MAYATFRTSSILSFTFASCSDLYVLDEFIVINKIHYGNSTSYSCCYLNVLPASKNKVSILKLIGIDLWEDHEDKIKNS